MPQDRHSWIASLSPQSRGLIAINLTAIIFGTAALYGKLDVSPIWISAIRGALGALVLAMLGGLSARLLKLSTATWGRLWLSGLLLAGNWLTFFWSVQLGGVAIATLTFSSFPLFTVLVEAISQRRAPHPIELLASGIIILAVALLVQPGSEGNQGLGALVGLSSAAVYALFWRVAQGLGEQLSAASISFSQNVIVFVLLVPLLFWAAPAPAGLSDWLALSGLGIVNTAIMLLLYLYALQHLSASTCSGFIALEPIYAISLAALLFNEPITPWIIASCALILGASMLLLRVERQATQAALCATQNNSA